MIGTLFTGQTSKEGFFISYPNDANFVQENIISRVDVKPVRLWTYCLKYTSKL